MMDAIKKQVIQNVAKRYKEIAYKEKRDRCWCADNVIAEHYKKMEGSESNGREPKNERSI